MELTRPRRGSKGTVEAAAAASAQGARDALWHATFYASTVSRVLPRGGLSPRTRLTSREERNVFVVGSPRSGTTFLARSIGSLPGFVDLGEVVPLKAALPALAAAENGDGGQGVRACLERVRTLALVPGLRAVEQTPELAFVLPSTMRAYPKALAVHMVRDGRDVACSLLERGWLRQNHRGRDDAKLPYGSHARFWVEPELARTFETVSDARRAAWAWRRYVEAVRAQQERVVEVRYEDLVTDGKAVAENLAGQLDVSPEPLVEAFSDVHGDSVGRYHAELTEEELADVEFEAGPLLRELGYM